MEVTAGMTKRGAVAGLLTLTPLVLLGAADDAAAAKVVVKNTKDHGKGSFNRAVRVAGRHEGRTKIVFASRLSGAIETGSVKFRSPVALKSKSRHVSLVGVEPTTNIRLNGARTRSHRAPDSTVRGLQLENIGILGNGGVRFKVADVRMSGSVDGDAPTGSTGISVSYYGKAAVERTTISGFDVGTNQESGSDVTIRDSLLIDNRVGTTNDKSGTDIFKSTITGSGDYGVYAGYYGSADIHNSTVSGNEGWATAGNIEMTGSTVSGNDGVNDGYDQMTFENSIVAGNMRADGEECVDPFGDDDPKSKGGNVFDSATNCASGALPSDAIVADAGLLPLADNGGPTPTQALTAGSPAIGQANANASKKDQRGVRRDRKADSGAYERRSGE